PLSMKYKEDYQAAGIPMLPVVSDPISVGRQIVLYSYVMVFFTLLLIPIAAMGLVYTIVAILGAAWFIYEAHLIHNQAKRNAVENPMRLFKISISYLTLLFIAVGIDPLLYIKLI
ncbi:MAG: hypothetical protein RIQ88_469, partial [Actinomycetota bacterium]